MFSKNVLIKKNAKLIDYYTIVDVIDDKHHKYNRPTFVCPPPVSKTFSSVTNYANISNNMRIANVVVNSLGGRIQFGNTNFRNNAGGGALNRIGLGPRNKF